MTIDQCVNELILSVSSDVHDDIAEAVNNLSSFGIDVDFRRSKYIKGVFVPCLRHYSYENK